MESQKKSIIRESVNWVKSFKIKNVDGEPDSLHEDLADLEYLIIYNLPYTVSKVAQDYDRKLKEYKDIKTQLSRIYYKIDFYNKEISKIKYDIKIQKLYLKKEELFRNCKQYHEDFESVYTSVIKFGYEEDVEGLYNSYIALIEERNEGKIYKKNIDIYNMVKILSKMKHVEKQPNNLKENCNKYKEYLKNIHFEAEELKQKCICIKNDINNIRENCLKSLIITESSNGMIELIKIEGKTPLLIDHLKSTVEKKSEKKSEKDKTFSKNFIFANLTFIMKINNKWEEVSIPIRVPKAGVVNLSYFKQAEYMSLNIGSIYNSSNEFLNTQMKYRYKMGASKNNIDIPEDFGNSQLFSHSEQALFFALESKEVRELIAKNLRMKLDSRKINYNTTFIKTIIIDLHTSRYMCDNCTISTLGIQNNKAFPSLKKLIEASVKVEIPIINFESDCVLHTRVSARINFETPIKKLQNHDKDNLELTKLKSDEISEKDIRINKNEGEILSGRQHYLSKQLLRYTLFTSSDTENQKLKTTYARAVYPALDDAAKTIQKSLRKFIKRNQQSMLKNNCDKIVKLKLFWSKHKWKEIINIIKLQEQNDFKFTHYKKPV